MFGQPVDKYVGKRFSAVPWMPENQALPVSRDGRDSIIGPGGDPQAGIRAGVLRHQLIIRTDADDRTLLGRQKKPGIAHPWQNRCRPDPAGAALTVLQPQIFRMPRTNVAIAVSRQNPLRLNEDSDNIGVSGLPDCGDFTVS